MVENNPQNQLAVELLDDHAYAAYLAGRHATVSVLSLSIENYAAKKLMLEQAVKAEKEAADVLREFGRLTITAGAANDELTAEKRTAILIKLRQILLDARDHFLYVNTT